MSGDGATHGRLYVCGTPIGNLDDVTPRLRAVLAAADVVACEDTRRTRTLLSAIDVPGRRVVSYRGDNEHEAAVALVEELVRGSTVALVSDAGMPGVSDPGALLVRRAHDAGVEVLGVAGPSAPTLAVALSGMGGSGHRFVAFLPRSRGALEQLFAETAHDVVVAFESPRRIVQTLAVLAAVQPERMVAVCRELTKRYEQTVIGEAAQLAATAATVGPRGEIVVVLDALPRVASTVSDDLVKLARALVDEGVGMKRVSRHLSEYAGVSSRELYAALIVSR